MSPALTRGSAAVQNNCIATTTNSSNTFFDPEHRSESPSVLAVGGSSPAPRQPFVPRRKERKTEPYPYLVPGATASADCIQELIQPAVLSVDSQRLQDLPPRPLSAWGAPSSSAQSSSAAPARSARSTGSTSRSLAPPSTESSRPTTPLTTPVLRAKASFVVTRKDSLATTSSPSVHLRPQPLANTASNPTPASFANASSAPQRTLLDDFSSLSVNYAAPVMSAPKIKATVSADVAARIRSPKKHASTSMLRSTASSGGASASSAGRSTPQPSYSQRATPALRHQASFVSSPLVSTSLDTARFSAVAHAGVTVDDIDGDGEGGDSSFVYDGPSESSSSLSSSLSPTGAQPDTVQVHVRLRPPKPGEECAWIASPFSGSIALEPGLAAARVQSAHLGPFNFDGIQTGSANRPVYVSVARPLIRAALDGYDAVVFAYGQTASGKTFTLSGDERGKEPGIIPRAVRDIFRGIRQSSNRREYLLRASYLEIWNEVVKDLLEPSNVPQVRDDKRKRGGKGTTVQPLREEIVTSPAQVRELLARGQANRHVGATDWNERSSRSHTCFKITIESWERDRSSEVASRATPAGSSASSASMGKKVTVSELCLIDLAGSEKYVSQGSDRRAEGSHINKSLLTLGKVIFALSDKGSQHVPYRDSKLTRILQNSLSGNARVAVVCTLNPHPNAIDESLSTLNFAKRIKKVSLNARRNEVDGELGALGAEAQALILRYQTEAEALRRMVVDLQQQSASATAAVVQVDDERIRELQERLDVIGSLVVRGGGVGSDAGDDVPGVDLNDDRGPDSGSIQRIGLDSDDEDSSRTPGISPSPSQSSRSTSVSGRSVARPVSPMKRGPAGGMQLFGYPEAPHLVAERLFLAEKQIESLKQELASRPSLPASQSEQAQLIAKQAQQIRELEAVCEAQATDAPPKIREDVEREFRDELDHLRQRLDHKDQFIASLQDETTRLRRANAKLMELAHQQTASMVETLSSPTKSPLKSSSVSSSAATPFANSTNTPTSRGLGRLSPSKPRPLSLFNPSFAHNALPEHGTPAKPLLLPSSASPKRRSISNDYSLLTAGTGQMEDEVTTNLALTPSETFAILPR
ncbi:kinesin-domain-containing protein [Testicularia cyperi]|uniref:Kinesin-domain-containing protein n=1 Tax=Testicularia cyperi TaxID=1882483 RepID=A0A317XL70_9BASI|nr:kinesin-domain-containing protein [Testicularia cyperi]